MHSSSTKKQALSVLSGFIYLLSLSALPFLGALNPYITSYYYIIQKQDITPSLTGAIQAFGGLIFATMITFTSFFTNLIGARNWMIFGGTTYIIFLFLSSFFANFWGFFVFYTIGMSITGLLQMSPIQICTVIFPKKKGFVTGIILAGFTIGPSFATLMSLSLMNPENLRPNKLPPYNEPYFPKLVAERFPDCLKIISLYFFILVLLGQLMMFEKENDESEESIDSELRISNVEPKLSIKEALNRRDIQILALMLFFVIPFYHFLINQQKIFGFSKNHSDTFLSTIGSAALFCNGGSRVIWGKVSDWVKNKSLLWIQISFILISTILMHLFSTHSVVFALSMIIQGICGAGMQVVLPRISINIFGTKIGPSVQGIVQIGNYSGSVFSFMIVSLVKPQIGFDNLFFIFYGGILISAIILFIFPVIDTKET